MTNNYHQSFTVFNALGDGVKIIKNEFSFFGVLILIYSSMTILSYMFFGDNYSNPEAMYDFINDNSATLVILNVVAYALYGIITIITLDKAHASYNNIDFNEYPYLTRAIKVLIPVVVIYILSMLLTILGTFLLIIPGIIVFLTLYLSIPAKLSENIGIIESLKRSATLTKGNRWGILGTILVPVIPIMIMSFLFASNLMSNFQEDGNFPPVIDPTYYYLYSIFGAIITVYFVVVMGVIYQQIVAERKTLEDESF